MSLLLILALLLAPASQPAAPVASERVVDNVRLRFHFAVPKAWKEVPQQPTEAVLYVFQLPATGEARKANPSLIITAYDAKGQELSAAVDRRREVIKERNAEAKFAQDQATTVAGHDGWTFVYDTMLTVTVTSNGNAHQEKMAVKVRDQLTLIDGRAIEVVLSSDDKGLLIRSKLVDRVTNTLVVEP